MNRDETIELLLRRLRASTSQDQEDEQAIRDLPVRLKSLTDLWRPAFLVLSGG
jgi:hypothetical protein